MIGYNVTSLPLELTFYAVAGGAIFYVIGEITGAMRRVGHRELGLHGEVRGLPAEPGMVPLASVTGTGTPADPHAH
jgi:hypothetical protein